MDMAIVSAFSRLDALEAKAKGPTVAADSELQAQLARFMCVLASGLIEQAVISLLNEYVATRSQLSVGRYARYQISRLQNAKFEDILQLLGRFDAQWRTSIENATDEDVKLAIDSIVNNRNQIAHGKQVSISIGTFSEYYLGVKKFIKEVEVFLYAA